MGDWRSLFNHMVDQVQAMVENNAALPVMRLMNYARR